MNLQVFQIMGVVAKADDAGAHLQQPDDPRRRSGRTMEYPTGLMLACPRLVQQLLEQMRRIVMREPHHFGPCRLPVENFRFFTCLMSSTVPSAPATESSAEAEAAPWSCGSAPVFTETPTMVARLASRTSLATKTRSFGATTGTFNITSQYKALPAST